MPNHLLFDLQQHGHLSRVSTLRAQGHSRGEIQAAVSSAVVVRVARDWIATPAASQLAVVAIGCGGKLTGAAALATYGVWDAVDRRIHVALRPNAHGTHIQLAAPIATFVAPRFPPGPVKLHWGREAVPLPGGAPWRVSVIDALVRVESDNSPDQFVACVDSAINTGQLSRPRSPYYFQHYRSARNSSVTLSTPAQSRVSSRWRAND